MDKGGVIVYVCCLLYVMCDDNYGIFGFKIVD